MNKKTLQLYDKNEVRKAFQELYPQDEVVDDSKVYEIADKWAKMINDQFDQEPEHSDLLNEDHIINAIDYYFACIFD